MNITCIFSMALFVMLPLLTMAQTEQHHIRAKIKKTFTLDDLIPGGSTYFQHSYPENRYLTWWGDQLVRLDMEETFLVDKNTGKETSLFNLEQLNTHSLRHLYDVSFPYPDQHIVLLQTNTERKLVDWSNGRALWSQAIDPQASNEDWNALSRNLAFVKSHNLYVTKADGSTCAVSNDGSLDIEYGISVHRDEFGISKGTFWSPDGQKLAFYRMDQTQVSTYPQVNIDGSSTSRCAQFIPDKYPMAGETSHQVTIGIYDVAKQSTVYLDCGDPTDCYFTNIAWAPDGRTLYLIELNRDQNYATLDAYDVMTGKKLSTLLTETNEKYVEPLHPILFLPWDASQFMLQSRKDGWSHLYLYRLSKDGRSANLVRQLTHGSWEVMNVAGFDKENHCVVYTSNEHNPIGCGIWAVNMRGQRTQMGNSEGWHTPSLSAATGSWLSDNWSSPSIARRIEIISAKGKSTLLANIQEPWGEYKVPEIRVGRLKAADGETELYYRLVLPTDFDASRQYPAVVYVYGGPHAHNIEASRNWGVRGWDIWMAQRGYVMFCLDNRGSEHRGRDFEQATFRHLGDVEMADQMEGLRFLKSLPYIDSTRIGVHGWSFGGFMTTNLMCTYPNAFKVGVAGGPVIDWKYYEVMYGERYMDTPQSNPEGYASSSLLSKAQNLRGRLLIIYGGQDSTCVPQHTLSFLRACIDAGTHPDLFTYPGQGHNMIGSDRVHLHEHITRYFDDFLMR